jgi:hypothetical protein
MGKTSAIAAASALFLGATLAAAVPAAASATATSQPAITASPVVNGSLSAVSASSSRDAWAVGTQTSATAPNLAEHWNGATWTRIPSPAPPDAKYGDFLNGITAVSAGNIWAVGCTDGCLVQGAFNPQIEHWNGKAWARS